MNALNDFLSVIAVILAIIFGIIIWAKLTFLRHDIIVDHIKKQGGKLIEKEWFTRTDPSDSTNETYYVIKYYDKNKKLHKTQLKVDEIKGEVLIEKDKIIG